MRVRAPPLRSEIHKAKWGYGRVGQSWLLASFRGCHEIAENADADMRDREKLAFEISCGCSVGWLKKVDNCGWLGSYFASAGGGTEAQTASARTVVPMSQKILNFYMKFT